MRKQTSNKPALLKIKYITKNELSEFSTFPDCTFYIPGSMDIDDFNDKFNNKLQESEEYNTGQAL